MTFEFTDELIEQLLLKRALSDKRYLNNISKHFDQRWFSQDNIRVLFKIALSYYRKYEKLPDNGIIKALGKKYTENHSEVKLADLTMTLNNLNNLEVDTKSDIAVQNIKNFVKDRAFYYSVIDHADDIMNKHDTDACIKKIEEINKMMFEDTNIGLDYFSKEGQEQHWEYLTNPEAKIPTLFQGLDQYMNGGLLREGKDLTCFVAQAGLGKSLFLSNLAVNCLRQNLSVAVISLEMSENVYAKRFSAHISETNINRLAENEQTARKNINEFYIKYPKCNLLIKEFPPRSMTTNDIENYLENVVAQGKKFDIIIIDYLNLVISSRKFNTSYESVLDVAEKLRATSYKFGVPVVTATQATTEGMNNEDIGMEHVSESRGITHTVDQLFALYQLDEDREHGQINLKVLKNRAGGRVGQRLFFKLNPQTLVLNDITFNPQNGVNDDMSESEQIISNLDHVEEDISEL